MKKLTMLISFSFVFFSSLLYLFHSFDNKKIDREQLVTQVMAYQMPDIIERCKKEFHYTDEDMQILEKEFKRFLIMCIITKDLGYGVAMYSKDVDNLWHSFILFTKEYAHFCNQYCGRFIHHVPTLKKDKTPEEMQKDFQKFIKTYEEIFNEEIHSIWFLDICEK